MFSHSYDHLGAESYRRAESGAGTPISSPTGDRSASPQGSTCMPGRVGVPPTLPSLDEGEWMVSKEYVRTRPLASIPMNDPVRILSEKLREFMVRVKAMPDAPDRYFHRKSNRVVLSMLQCRMPDGSDAWFEGINGEMSLPTGSLCSERAAIAHARSRHPELTRSNFRAIAVLEIPLVRVEGQDTSESELDNPLWPCGACMEWLKKIQEKVENFR